LKSLDHRRPDLKCELRGATMAKSGEAAAYASKLADEMEHHPTIVLEYAGMTLRIHTHDKNAITVMDLVYAAGSSAGCARTAG
jgi:pterin-4a-carbinolamine dehydratase